ncbi:MAG: ATP-dependent DNA helicase [Burkholderiales bacterium]|nr:ATP-dependent DNA helicase [Burkholderiales bacterium]
MPLPTISDIESVFSENGLLSGAIEGFRARPQQSEMAVAILDAISRNGALVVEAGTGTGKTFAYLVPALLSGGKIIVSTGTKTLQDQLYTRDIPAMRQALGVSLDIALLKGRANYVCHYHLERTSREGRLPSRENVAYLKLVEGYARNTKSGDKGELVEVPEDASIWPLVTSTRENCLGSECPNHKECFVMEARRSAMRADLVVVNHHLFFADVMLKDEGVAELLPACNTVIFDEAHQLPEVASLFLGESVGTSQLIELARDARLEAQISAKDFAPLPQGADKLEKSARDLRLAVLEADSRLPVSALDADFFASLASLQGALDEFSKLLELQAERSEGLGNCRDRAVELSRRIKNWREEESGDFIRWVEVFSQAMQLNSTPLSIAEMFASQIEARPRSWIFTSATLAVGGDFSHYLGQMGLADAKSLCLDSPFDYPNQALLYVPESMPEPNSRDYTKAVVDAALPLIRASRGRAFLLFTSLKAMRAAHGFLKEAFLAENLDFPILLQGEGAKNAMLERFRRLGNAVLLGSQSFWEGVDVRGEALSLVVIDKLPFAPPDDPVLAARIEQINRRGGNAFMEYQLPHAVLTLKQGAGRLIRSEADRGALMICDPRIITKSYGSKVWRSLPPMKRTRLLQEAVEFFGKE